MAITTTTLAIITIAATVASAAGAIISSQQAASQAEAEAEARARQSEDEAEIASQRAARETQVAAQTEGDFRARQRRAAAAVRAAGGGRGIDISVGSPLLTAEDFTRQAEIQSLRIREGGEVRSTRLEQQASLLTNQAGSFRALGSSRASGLRTAGFIGAGTSLLSGASRTARIFQE